MTSTPMRAAGIAAALVLTALPAVPATATATEPDDPRAPRIPATGEGFSLAAANLDGRPGDELIVGGRVVTALDDRSLTEQDPMWTYQWPSSGESWDTPDNTWALDVEAIHVNADAIPDVLLTTSSGQAQLLDGRDGRQLWSVTGTSWMAELTLFDAPGDAVPDFFPTGTRVARSGATGQVLWEASDLTADPVFAAAAELDGLPGRDVLLLIERDTWWGSPSTGPELWAYSGDGTLLWSERPAEMAFSLQAGDVDGDGVDEAVIGMDNGMVGAYGSDGMLWETSVSTGSGAVRALSVVDTDGDGRDDVYTSTGDWSTGLAVLGADGALKGVVATDAPVRRLSDHVVDGSPRIVAAVHDGESGEPGALVAFDASVEPLADLWSARTTTLVLDQSTASVGGRDVLFWGGYDGLVQGVDLATGEPALTYHGGGFVRSVSAGDVDGLPGDEVARVDAGGQLAVHTAKGDTVLKAQLLDGAGVGHDVTVAQLDEDGPEEVVGAAGLFAGAQRGVVTRFDDSRVTWTTRLEGEAQVVTTAELDGLPGPEVVVAELVPYTWWGGFSYVTALDGDTGELLWRQHVAWSFQTRLDTADVDGDGLSEIAFGDTNIATKPTIAVLGPDGTVRWSTRTDTNGAFLEFDGEDLVSGGGYRGKGKLDRHDALDGTHVLSRTLAQTDRRSSEVRFGALAPDTTGDGVREVAVSLAHAAEVRLLDGATGEPLWSLPTAGDGSPLTGGPITMVRQTPASPVRLLVGQSASFRSAAEILSVDLDGTVLQRWATTGHAVDAVTLSQPGRVQKGAIAAGMSVYVKVVR